MVFLFLNFKTNFYFFFKFNSERLYIVKQDDVEVKLKKVDSEAQLGSHGSADVVVVTKTVEEPSNYCPGILKLT